MKQLGVGDLEVEVFFPSCSLEPKYARTEHSLREALLMPKTLTSKWRAWSQLSLPDNRERGKMKLALHIVHFFGLQFYSQMGNKLNQQAVIKK